MTFNALLSHCWQLVMAFFASIGGYLIINSHQSVIARLLLMAVLIVAWAACSVMTFLNGET